MVRKLNGDEAALMSTGALMAAYGAQFALAPKQAFNVYFKDDASDFTSTRWFGYFATCLGAADMVVAGSEGGERVKKNVCKLAGVGWLGGAGLTAMHLAQGKQKKELGAANIALGVGAGAALLWRGFRPEPKKEVAKTVGKPAAGAASKAKGK